MNESDKFEELQEGGGRENEVYTDPYVSESSSDIYATPEVVEPAAFVEETENAPVVADTHGLFSGNQADSQSPYGYQDGNYGTQSPYGYPQGGYVQSPYGSQNPQGGYGMQQPYGNQNLQGGYGEQSPYGNQSQQGDGYNMQPPYGNQSQSGYGMQQPYGNPNPQGGYDAQAAYGGQNPQGGFGAQPSYGSQQAGGGYGGQPPFGGQPPYDNPYSPYAMPQKKQNTGLIVGIVIGIIVLFLVAVFALASKAVNMLSEKEKEDLRRDVYDFDDDYDDRHRDEHDDYDFDYHYDDDFDYDYNYDDDYDYSDFFNYDDFYGDDYYEDAEYDDRYYNLHNEIASDLSYQVELEDFDYESDYENAIILASIPVISGEDVPNLDKINKDIRKEVDEMTKLFESEYESHIKESEENYFMASLTGYVAYMDEDKLSIAWQEEMYSDRDGFVYLQSINVDMKNGVVLDNEDILAIDDEFSVEFRQKSDEQNGEISYLTYMTDQQITDYFESDAVIVFYTPKGMEIGFNYEEGWVTVTYEEYEKYLKVF